MHVDSIKTAFPSRIVDNDEILELLRQHSSEGCNGSMDRALALIKRLLRLSGARTRRWLADGETPLALIVSAVNSALAEAGIGKDEVDLLIYVGVGRGFVEPGQAYMVAHALGLNRAACFDILDACMSWSRALQIAEDFLRLRRHRRILIVNGELNTYEGGPLFPSNYRLRSVEEIEWTFPSYTIGNVAAATLVSADDDNPWTWRVSSRPDLADLCTIPSARPDLFAAPGDKIGKNGPFRFTSFANDLVTHGFPVAIGLMRDLLAEHGDIKRIFPHASSFRDWARIARELGIEDRIHHMYPEYGNMVSASVPAGIASAVEEGLVQRGDRLAGWVASAGMSFAAYTFTY